MGKSFTASLAKWWVTGYMVLFKSLLPLLLKIQTSKLSTSQKCKSSTKLAAIHMYQEPHRTSTNPRVSEQELRSVSQPGVEIKHSLRNFPLQPPILWMPLIPGRAPGNSSSVLYIGWVKGEKKIPFPRALHRWMQGSRQPALSTSFSQLPHTTYSKNEGRQTKERVFFVCLWQNRLLWRTDI